jgi:hypothetical protein
MSSKAERLQPRAGTASTLTVSGRLAATDLASLTDRRRRRLWVRRRCRRRRRQRARLAERERRVEERGVGREWGLALVRLVVALGRAPASTLRHLAAAAGRR